MPVKEAAGMLGVSTSTVRSRIKNGTLQSKVEAKDGRKLILVEVAVPFFSTRFDRFLKQIGRAGAFGAGAAVGGIIGNRADYLFLRVAHSIFHPNPQSDLVPIWVKSTLIHLSFQALPEDVGRAIEYADILGRPIRDDIGHQALSSHLLKELLVADRVPSSWYGSRALLLSLAKLAVSDPDRAIALTMTISDDMARSSALSEVAQQISNSDIERSIALISDISDDNARSAVLSKVAQDLSVSDIERAIALTLTIANKDASFFALKRVTEELAKTDIERAISLARDSILRKHFQMMLLAHLARADLNRAITLAMTISDENERSGVLMKIAVTVAETDPEGAIILARIISTDSSRKMALSGIAERLAETDIDRAIALETETSTPNNHRLAKLLAQLAVSDPVTAMTLTTNLSDDNTRSMVQVMIARAVASRSDTERAFMLAGEISRPDNYYFPKLCSQLATLDLERTIALTTTIADEIIRSTVQRMIAQQLADTDLERAILLATTISEEDQRSMALDTIAERLGDTDIDRAIALASEISGWRPPLLLGELVAHLARSDLERAIGRAAAIGDDNTRAMVLSSIVQEVASSDIDRAIMLVRSIPKECDWIWQASAIAGIAIANPTAAMTILGTTLAVEIPTGAYCFYCLLESALMAEIPIDDPDEQGIDTGDWLRHLWHRGGTFADTFSTVLPIAPR